MRRRPHILAYWRLIAAGLFVALLIVGCSPQKRYQVMRVFFDGVPDPDAPPASAKTFRSRQNPNAKASIVHKPFAEEKCDSCHLNTDDIFARARVAADVCSSCHADVKSTHLVTHGPVESDACRLCHEPHQSVNAHLLRMPSPDVCTQCHAMETLDPVPPEHLDPEANCLTCHNGHGGSDRRFLKLAVAAPATRPASEVTP